MNDLGANIDGEKERQLELALHAGVISSVW